MADESRWYVVHTYSGYENKVASNLETTVQNRQLQDLIQEVRVPTETVTEVKDNKRRDVERKIFPGYVLVKMILTDESWYVVRNIRGCTGFVGPSSKPIPLSEDTAFGALMGYATDPQTTGYQPMHVNFGIMRPLDERIRNKRERYAAYARRGSEALAGYCGQLRQRGLLPSEEGGER